ncbi:MAG: hypothetical protein ACK4M9_03145 [Anaerobacillus sp.]|jgi:hypothetical protein
MAKQDMKQYKVTRGKASDSGISATYEYTSGNKTGNKIKARRSN